MIKLKGLNKSFGNQKVLSEIDLQINRGRITAILGPNGSGKTTMIKSILGLSIPQKGEIEYNGQPIKNEWHYRNDIGYLPQAANFPENLTVKELIEMVKDIRRQPCSEQPLVDLFGLSEFLDHSVRTLSGGTRQKINVMLAFMFDNSCYIMDEPTVGLDPVSLIKFKEYLENLKSNGKTLLFTTHIMKLVEDLADEIVFLLEGRIYFQGTLQEINQMTGNKDLEKSIASIIDLNNKQ